MPPNEPHQAPDSLSSLPELLHDRRTSALIADAELIRDAPAGDERDDEARRAIRDAMLLYTLHRITAAERDRILNVLSFLTVHESPPSPDRPPYPFLDDTDHHGPLH